MSVQPGPTFKRYAANGIAPTYAITFLLLDAADLQITLDGVLITSGFTLSGIGNPTSSCTFTVPPLGDLLFQQVMPFQRLTDYQINGDFLAQTVNPDFDRLWLAVKQLYRDNGRALTVSLLEPEGIPPLPSKALRALKMLAFDGDGIPTPSNLTLEQIEQQPALAMASAEAAAASAVLSGEKAGESEGSAIAAAASEAAAAASVASVAGAAVALFTVHWWPGVRAAIPAGYGPADGQTLSRTLYPDVWAGVNAGNMPTAADATWLSTPAERGKYTTGNGTTTFRVPDYNGKFAGSIGAPFLRGDGTLSAGVTGAIQLDAFQGHEHLERLLPYAYGATALSIYGPGGTIGSEKTAGLTTDGVNGTPRSAVETRPLNVTGCFIIKLFGAVTNQGAADAALLATEVAALASRCTSLEGRATALEFGYISANQTWAVGTPIAVSHGLGSRPMKTSIEAECMVADAGYSIGAVVDLGASQCVVSGANSYGFTTEMSTTQLIVNIGATGLSVINKSTKAVAAMTPASWRLRLKASKS